jgi:cyclophilin family peptidyl-prolyl cis-trans isomerase
MPVPCPNADGSSEKRQKFNEPLPMCIGVEKRYSADIVTNLGSLTVALDAAAAPRTVNNFVVLARYHYYDGVIFHRIIKGFMCQGGDPTGTGRGGPGYQFADELPAPGRYEIGSIAMANAGPDTNGSQFFIVSGPSGTRLPPQYSLFGKVVKGLEVLAEMEAVDTDRSDRPRADVVIESVTVHESD